MLKPLDVVVITEDLPDHGVRQGDVGTVVECYKQPSQAYEVELVNRDGSTKALLTLFPHQVRPAMKNEINGFGRPFPVS